MNIKISKLILLLILGLTIIVILKVILGMFFGNTSEVNRYLKAKYNLLPNQYKITSFENGKGFSDTYFLIDNKENKFEVDDFGSDFSHNFLDDYSKVYIAEDILKVVKKYIDAKVVNIDTDFHVTGFFNEKYDGNLINFINKDVNKVPLKGFPIRIWIESNDRNVEEVKEKIKNGVNLISKELNCGINIYQVRDTFKENDLIDYKWNANETKEDAYQYSFKCFYYLTWYKNVGKDSYMTDIITQKTYHYWW